MPLRPLACSAIAAALLAAPVAVPAPLAAQAPGAAPASAPTYADLAALADAAPLVVRARIRSQAEVEAARAPGLAPGHVRLFVVAETRGLYFGSAPLGTSLRYLVDLPRDAKGKAPRLKKREMILFARPVPARPGELVLVDPSAQLDWSAETEARLRPILAELHAAGAPPKVVSVRDALGVEGTLAGESETQIFLATASGEPASITIARRPGQEPRWGVSWTEIVDQSATPPARDTLAWYRLACALPPRLPAGANLAQDQASRALAVRDYGFVLQQLGPCERSRR